MRAATPNDGEMRERVRQLLEQVLARPVEQWDDALERTCREHAGCAPSLRSLYAELARSGMTHAQAYPERLGDYRLLERIGAGGMGAVFRAEQVSPRRMVALKVIRPDGLFFPEHVARFRREVLALAALQHPHVVKMLDGGEENGVPWCAMELVPGRTLAEALRDLAGRPPASLQGSDLARAIGSDRDDLYPRSWITTCFSIAESIARALHHAHERGIVHRDVKPSNVMLGRNGEVLLIDFGLARTQEWIAGSEVVTATHVRLGSLPYLAPEVVRGDSRDADAAADVYGLGATLYETLVLRQPFGGGDQEAVRRNILHAAPTPLRRLHPGVPRDAAAVCMQALHHDRRMRYASAADLAADLRRVRDGLPPAARPRRPGRALARAASLVRASRARPWTWMTIAVSLLIVASVSVGSVLASYRARLREQEVHLRVRDAPGRFHALWNLGARYILGNSRADYAGWARDYLRVFADLGVPLVPETERRAFVVRWQAVRAMDERASAALRDGLLALELRLAQAGAVLAWARSVDAPHALPASWDERKRQERLRIAMELQQRHPDLVQMWPDLVQLVRELESDTQLGTVHDAWIRWRQHGDASGLEQLAADPTLQGTAASRLGEMCIEALGPARARALLERAVAGNESDFRAHFYLGFCCRSLAQTSGELSDIQAAIRHYDIATSLDQTSPWAWTNLGEAYAGLGQLAAREHPEEQREIWQRAAKGAREQAKAAYHRAIDLGPQVAAARNNLANCLEPDDPERQRLIDEALAIAPEQPTMLRSAANLAYARKQWERGFELDRRLIAVDPADAESRCDFAVTLFEVASKRARGAITTAAADRELLLEAIRHLEHARGVRPQWPRVHELLFACHARLGEFAAGMQHLTDALELRAAATIPDPHAHGQLRGVLSVLDALAPAVETEADRAAWGKLRDRVARTR